MAVHMRFTRLCLCLFASAWCRMARIRVPVFFFHYSSSFCTARRVNLREKVVAHRDRHRVTGNRNTAILLADRGPR